MATAIFAMRRLKVARPVQRVRHACRHSRGCVLSANQNPSQRVSDLISEPSKSTHNDTLVPSGNRAAVSLLSAFEECAMGIVSRVTHSGLLWCDPQTLSVSRENEVEHRKFCVNAFQPLGADSSGEISKTSLMALNSASCSGVAASSIRSAVVESISSAIPLDGNKSVRNSQTALLKN